MYVLLSSLNPDLRFNKTKFLVSVFAAVNQDLSDRIAKAIGAPTVKPLAVKSASEAPRFKPNVQNGGA